MYIYNMKNSNEKFKKLANSRVNKAMKFIKLVGNLSNKSHYNYTDAQVKQIISTLENEIKIIKHKFSNSSSNRDRKEFELE